MKQNIFELKVNYAKIHEEIHKHAIRSGNPAKYIIMSKETAKGIVERTPDFGHNKSYDSDNLEKVFGISIAYCEELSLGEIEVV